MSFSFLEELKPIRIMFPVISSIILKIRYILRRDTIKVQGLNSKTYLSLKSLKPRVSYLAFDTCFCGIYNKCSYTHKCLLH